MRKMKIVIWGMLLCCFCFSILNLKISYGLENKYIGNASRIGGYIGEYEGWHYFSEEKVSWNMEGLFSQSWSCGSGNGVWAFSKELNSAEYINEESFTDDLYDQMRLWDTDYNVGKTIEYTVDQGIVYVDGTALFTVPGWTDGSGETETRIGVKEYKGFSEEKIYVLNYTTLPKTATPPHDYSTYVIAIVENNTVKIIQSKNKMPLPRVHFVIPWGDHQYLAYGDRIGLGEPAPIVIEPDGTYVDIKTSFCQKLDIPEDNQEYIDVLGIRNDKIVIMKHEPNEEYSWENFRDIEVYEMDHSLNVLKSPENFKWVREINCYPTVVFSASGHILVVTDDEKKLYDLTTSKSQSISGGENGAYHYCGNYTIIMAKTGKETTLPIYEYEGKACICIENFEDRNYKMKWNPTMRETTFTFSSDWKPTTLKRLSDGQILESDIIISVDGAEMPSYNTGGWSLVPIESLIGIQVISENVDLEKMSEVLEKQN